MKMLLSELRRLIQSTIEEMANRAPVGAELDELLVDVEAACRRISLLSLESIIKKRDIIILVGAIEHTRIQESAARCRRRWRRGVCNIRRIWRDV